MPGPVPASTGELAIMLSFRKRAMMLKDLKLAQDAAKAAGATTPLGAEAAALYGRYVEGGGAGRDFSGIVEMIRKGS